MSESEPFKPAYNANATSDVLIYLIAGVTLAVIGLVLFGTYEPEYFADDGDGPATQQIVGLSLTGLGFLLAQVAVIAQGVIVATKRRS